jgi:hypothetical protein
MMGAVTISLLQHWIDALQASSGLCARVYRFLIRFYGEQAGRIVFPSRPGRASFVHLDPETPPKAPRTSDQIRSLIINITEAVRRSTPRDSW